MTSAKTPARDRDQHPLAPAAHLGRALRQIRHRARVPVGRPHTHPSEEVRHECPDVVEHDTENDEPRAHDGRHVHERPPRVPARPKTEPLGHREPPFEPATDGDRAGTRATSRAPSRTRATRGTARTPQRVRPRGCAPPRGDLLRRREAEGLRTCSQLTTDPLLCTNPRTAGGSSRA